MRLLGLVVLIHALHSGTSAAKIKSEDSRDFAVQEALQAIFLPRGGSSEAPFRWSEEQIQRLVEREGITRVRVKDPKTGEEFDDVFMNETSSSLDGEDGNDICHTVGAEFTPSTELVQTAKKVLETEFGSLMSTAMGAYIDIAEYFGKELFHLEAPLGSEKPVEEPHGDAIVRLAEEWSEELNAQLVKRGKEPCPNAPEWLLYCIKQTTCLLEIAVEQDPHLITPGRMATYMEVEKQVQDHFEEFLVEADLGMPHVYALCEGEEDSLSPAALVQLKSQLGAGSSQRSQALEAVVHMQKAATRTVRALSNRSNLDQLEVSFFSHTWKKACELIGCKTTSFVDIMDASVGHTAELVDVQASWHAVRTHHKSFMQFRTSVASAIHASDAFHGNFVSFLYQPGRSKGARRADAVFKEAGDVLNTALALKRRGNDDGRSIKSSWWCLSWKATANAGYAKKFPDPTAMWGVGINFKFMSGHGVDFVNLVKSINSFLNDFKISVGLTIGYIPNIPGLGDTTLGKKIGITKEVKTIGGKLAVEGFRTGVSVEAASPSDLEK